MSCQEENNYYSLIFYKFSLWNIFTSTMVRRKSLWTQNNTRGIGKFLAKNVESWVFSFCSLSTTRHAPLLVRWCLYLMLARPSRLADSRERESRVDWPEWSEADHSTVRVLIQIPRSNCESWAVRSWALYAPKYLPQFVSCNLLQTSSIMPFAVIALWRSVHKKSHSWVDFLAFADMCTCLALSKLMRSATFMS